MKSLLFLTISRWQLLFNQASPKNQRHIVLPEGEEPRILAAADYLLKRGIVDITLLGSADKIKRQAKRLHEFYIEKFAFGIRSWECSLDAAASRLHLLSRLIYHV